MRALLNRWDWSPSFRCKFSSETLRFILCYELHKLLIEVIWIFPVGPMPSFNWTPSRSRNMPMQLPRQVRRYQDILLASHHQHGDLRQSTQLPRHIKMLNHIQLRQIRMNRHLHVTHRVLKHCQLIMPIPIKVLRETPQQHIPHHMRHSHHACRVRPKLEHPPTE